MAHPIKVFLTLTQKLVPGDSAAGSSRGTGCLSAWKTWSYCLLLLLVTGSEMLHAQVTVNDLSDSEQSMLKSWMCTYAYPGILPTCDNFLLAVEDQQVAGAEVLRGKLRQMNFQLYSVNDTILFVEGSSEEKSTNSVLKESIRVDRAYCLNCPIDIPTQVLIGQKWDERHLGEILDSLNRWRRLYRNTKYEMPPYAYIEGLKRERISARLAFYRVNNNWSVDVLCGNPQMVQHLYFSRELIERMSGKDVFNNVTRIELTYECVDFLEIFIPPWFDG